MSRVPIRPKERESDIQRTIMDGLSAMRIWHVRMNTGGMFGVHKGKRWAVRFGRKGMADILAIRDEDVGRLAVYWIEVKRPGEKQTADQEGFEREVRAEGMGYILANSWESVLEVLKT
jgi:hypothetical protein